MCGISILWEFTVSKTITRGELGRRPDTLGLYSEQGHVLTLVHQPLHTQLQEACNALTPAQAEPWNLVCGLWAGAGVEEP